MLKVSFDIEVPIERADIRHEDGSALEVKLRKDVKFPRLGAEELMNRARFRKSRQKA